jgi:hypothetical protein
MTAFTPTPAGLTTLDMRITQALTALRLARLAGGKSRDAAFTEERAEADLNALLDYRYAAQRR